MQRPTAQDVENLVLSTLQEQAMSIPSLIDKLCAGPSDHQVREAAWKLLYDESAVELDDQLRLVAKPVGGT